MNKSEMVTARKSRSTSDEPAAADDLRSAARLVEDSAFSLATDHPTEVIAQLIIIAADLERLAQVVDRNAKPPN